MRQKRGLGRRLAADPSGRPLLPRLGQTAVRPRRLGRRRDLLGASEHLNVGIRVVVLGLGRGRGRLVSAGLLLRCRAVALVLALILILVLVLRPQIVFAALFLPFLRH